MPSLTEIDGSMKALRNVTRIVVLNLPQLSSLSLRASLLYVNEVEMENAGLFEKSEELREGLKRMKENEEKEREKREMEIKKKTECLRRFLSWLNVALCVAILVFLATSYHYIYHGYFGPICDDGCHCDWNKSTPNYIVILSVFYWFFTLFLLIYELHIKGLDAWLHECSFLFTYIARDVLLFLWGLVFPFHV